MATNKRNKREDNLNKIDSVEMAREYQKRSVASRNKNTADRKNIKIAVETLLEKLITAKDGTEMSGAEAIVAKQFEKALKGDSKSFELLRDSAGQKPVEKIQMAEIDASVIDEVERAVLDDEYEIKDNGDGTFTRAKINNEKAGS